MCTNSKAGSLLCLKPDPDPDPARNPENAHRESQQDMKGKTMMLMIYDDIWWWRQWCEWWWFLTIHDDIASRFHVPLLSFDARQRHRQRILLQAAAKWVCLGNENELEWIRWMSWRFETLWSDLEQRGSRCGQGTVHLAVPLRAATSMLILRGSRFESFFGTQQFYIILCNFWVPGAHQNSSAVQNIHKAT